MKTENYDWKDIKSYEDACKVLNLRKVNKFILFLKEILRINDTIDEIAYKKLKVIIRAINQGWKPDFKNTDQKKYYPYFDLSSVFRFGDTYSYYYHSGTLDGVRLCFESQEKAEYMGKTFVKLYEEYLS